MSPKRTTMEPMGNDSYLTSSVPGQALDVVFGQVPPHLATSWRES